MLWKKDRLRPTQPFFVLNTKNFRQEVYLRQGISHFYAFTIENPQTIPVVPDACVDLFFEYTGTGMEAFACGTPLEISMQEWKGKREVFGVRFMPGVQPDIIAARMKDLVGKKTGLEGIVLDEKLLPLMEEQEDFYQRIRVFLQQYTRAQNRAGKMKTPEKKELMRSVKSMVYESDGKIRISGIAERTGYSERYINKVFLDEMGFPPKTFCKIIQFQRALEFLNYGAPDKMTDAAVYLGYYDQPQFIRNFKTYSGVTPLQYLNLTRVHKYKKQIQETDFLKSSDLYKQDETKRSNLDT